jgi:hypothetical protein
MKCSECEEDFNDNEEEYVLIRTVWVDTEAEQLRFISLHETYHTECYDDNFPPEYKDVWGSKKFLGYFSQVKKGTRIIEGEPFPEFVVYPIVPTRLWKAEPDFLSEAPKGCEPRVIVTHE